VIPAGETAIEVRERSSRTHVLIITFALNDLADADYRQLAEALAPQFLQVPGLMSKTWLADEVSNTYGGIYDFEDAAAHQRYLASEIVMGMKANPAFAEVRIRPFGTIEAATAITGGPLAEARVTA
jgi:hypothetical protein